MKKSMLFIFGLISSIVFAPTENPYDLALLKAAAEGQAFLIEPLLMAKADINTQDLRRDTPLHIAIKNQQSLVVAMLIKHRNNGLDFEIFNERDKSPLQVASEIGDLVSSQKLVCAGADVNGKGTSTYACTALHDASRSGKIEIVRFLINNNADVNEQTMWRVTPLHESINQGDNKEVVRLLLDQKADINLHNPLFEAADNGRVQVVELLIAAKADPFALEFGETARIVARMNSYKGENFVDIEKLLGKAEQPFLDNELSARFMREWLSPSLKKNKRQKRTIDLPKSSAELSPLSQSFPSSPKITPTLVLPESAYLA